MDSAASFQIATVPFVPGDPNRSTTEWIVVGFFNHDGRGEHEGWKSTAFRIA